MTDYYLAILLGVVEGITEFLPISSTAHLRISQYFLGLSLEDEYWKLFAVFIQLGAICSVLLLYRERIWEYTKHLNRKKLDQNPLFLTAVAFLCTAIPAFLMKKIIGQNLESLWVMAGALFIGGLIMYLVDYKFSTGKITQITQSKISHAIFIGFVQVLSAVFPGTSRSMSTIAAGQLVGMNRSVALDFSFLLSIPTMIVATLYDLYKYKKELGAIEISAHQFGVLAVGFVVSFVVAYIVVAWFLNYVKKKGFTPFAIYRVLLAILLLSLLK